jgi:hypothetical protein
MKKMNRNIERNVESKTIARAIWEGKAIMGTDGSVRDPTATYSFVISISRTDVKTNVRGGGFLPPTAKYLDPYSKRPEAAALHYLLGLHGYRTFFANSLIALIQTHPLSRSPLTMKVV